MSSRWIMSRRAVLRGLGVGGVAIALPQLDAMFDHRGRLHGVAAAQPLAAPKRLVLFHFGCGAAMMDWIPSGEGTSWTMSPALMPLGPHRDRITVLTGLSNESVTSLLDANKHPLSMIALATGETPLVVAETDRDPILTAGGASVDQVAADEIGTTTRFSSLTINGVPDEARGGDSRRISFRGPNSPVAPFTDPHELFTQLFSDFTPAGAPPPDTSALEMAAREKRSVLDYVMASISQVHAQVGVEDRTRLDEHLTAVRELERSIAALPAPASGESCELPSDPGSFDYGPEVLPQRSEALIRLAAMALRCDLTRIVSFSLCPTNGVGTPTFLGMTDSEHNISHGDILGDPSVQAKLTQLAAWKVGRFGLLLDELVVGSEGDGTVLDHSAVVCISELSDPGFHSNEIMPCIVAGGLGGMPGGRHIRYACERPSGQLYQKLGSPAFCSATESERLTNLWLTMLQAVGAETSSFGNSSRVLPDLWV